MSTKTIFVAFAIACIIAVVVGVLYTEFKDRPFTTPGPTGKGSEDRKPVIKPPDNGKPARQFICSKCNHKSPVWLELCPECKNLNTFGTKPEPKPPEPVPPDEIEKPDPRFVVSPVATEPVESEKEEAKEKYGKKFFDLGTGGWAISKEGKEELSLVGLLCVEED